MTTPHPAGFDPLRDLLFERTTELTPAQIWRAWTTPELLMQWFTPAPWKTIACTIDLRPGGAFHTTMQSPEGETFPGTGCFLEVIPQEKLVWTSALAPDFRPQEEAGGGPSLTAVISLRRDGTRTHYQAWALHRNSAERDAHAAMGFEEGWGKAFSQMEALMRE